MFALRFGKSASLSGVLCKRNVTSGIEKFPAKDRMWGLYTVRCNNTPFSYRSIYKLGRTMMSSRRPQPIWKHEAAAGCWCVSWCSYCKRGGEGRYRTPSSKPPAESRATLNKNPRPPQKCRWTGCSQQCPRWDSNSHWTGFESVASANWATGAYRKRC